MEIGVEVSPSKKGVFLRRVASLMGKADFISIPDSPFGRPAPSSLIMATLLKVIGMEAIPNFRLADRNEVSFLSEMMGIREVGINRVLLVGGDPPIIGKPTDLDPLRAISLLKDWEINLEIGVASSLKPNDRIKRKLEAGADFVVTQPIQRVEELIPLSTFIGDVPLSAMIMPTLSELEDYVLRAMEIEEVLEIDYKALLDDLRESGLVKGVVISVPRRPSKVHEILR